MNASFFQGGVDLPLLLLVLLLLLLHTQHYRYYSSIPRTCTSRVALPCSALGSTRAELSVSFDLLPERLCLLDSIVKFIVCSPSSSDFFTPFCLLLYDETIEIVSNFITSPRIRPRLFYYLFSLFAANRHCIPVLHNE
jgi:hypothetical protein